MPHFDRLQSLQTKINTYEESLQKRVADYVENNNAKINEIKDVCLHLDSILQVETRRRKQAFQDIVDETAHKCEDAQRELDVQIAQIIESNRKDFDQIYSKAEKFTMALQIEQRQLQIAVDDWKSAASKSTQQVATNLNVERDNRFNAYTTSRNAFTADIQALKSHEERRYIKSDEQLLNVSVYAAQLLKNYESTNQQGIQSMQFLGQQMRQQLEQEILNRQTQFNQIAHALSGAVESLQTSMNKLGEFYTNADVEQFRTRSLVK